MNCILGIIFFVIRFCDVMGLMLDMFGLFLVDKNNLLRCWVVYGFLLVVVYELYKNLING